MTTKTPDTLTREYGMQNLVTPTGRQLGFKKWATNQALLQVTYIDGKAGALPESLNGTFTKVAYAEQAIRKYLKEFWDQSDKAAGKRP